MTKTNARGSEPNARTTVAAAAITGNTNRRKHRKSSVNDAGCGGGGFKGAQCDGRNIPCVIDVFNWICVTEIMARADVWEP